MIAELKTGTKAYFDALYFGLIPCVVVSVGDAVKVKLTASRGQFDTYKRGEIVETTALHVFPRVALRGRTILAYTVVKDGGQ